MALGMNRGLQSFAGAADDPRGTLLKRLCDAYGGKLNPADADALVAELATNRNNPEAIQRILGHRLSLPDKALSEVIETLIKRGARNDVAWLPLEALIKRSDSGVIGFKATPELDASFQRWKQLKEAESADGFVATPEGFIHEMRLDQAIKLEDGVPAGFTIDRANSGYRAWARDQVRRAEGITDPVVLNQARYRQFPPQQYLDSVAPGKRPATALETLFGHDQPVQRVGRDAIDSAPRANHSDFAKTFRRPAHDVPAGWKNDIRNLLTNHVKLRKKVRDAFDARYPHPRPSPDMDDAPLWDDRVIIVVDSLLDHHIFRDITGEVGEMHYDRFLRETVDDEMLTRLLGPSVMRDGIAEKEFVERLVDAYSAFGVVAVNMNVPWDSGAYKQVGGMFELVQKAMSQSGTVRGYAFELETIFYAIRVHGDEVIIVLQRDIAGQQGPDMMLIVGDIVRIVQKKSHGKLSEIYGMNGVAAWQTGSDLRRFLSEVDAARLADPDAPIPPATEWPRVMMKDHGTKRLHNEWEFEIDARRPDVTPTQIANAQDSFNDMNDLFARTAEPAANHQLTEVLFKASGGKVSENNTIRNVLDSAITSADPPLSMAEAAIFRTFLKRKMGDLPDEMRDQLLDKARRIAKFYPPLRIVPNMRLQRHMADASFAQPHEGLRR